MRREASSRTALHRSASTRVRLPAPLSVRRRSSSYSGTRCCTQLERNVPFYQTNPPFFGRIFVASGYEWVLCTRNTRRNSVGSFSRTNPPERGFWRGSVAATTTLRHLPPKYSVWRVVRLRSVRLGLGCGGGYKQARRPFYLAR